MEKALHMSARDNPHYDSMVVDFAVILSKTNHVDAALEFLDREIAESPGFARAWSARALHPVPAQRTRARPLRRGDGAAPRSRRRSGAAGFAAIAGGFRGAFALKILGGV